MCFLHVVAVRGAVPVRVDFFRSWSTHFGLGLSLDLTGSNFWMPDGRARQGLNDVQIFSRAFLDCAVMSFTVRVETWIDSYDIVFVSSATNVLRLV